MSEFWPSGLDLGDTSSPLQILQAAQVEWTEQSGGLLALVIQEAESNAGNPFLTVHAKHVPSNRTVNLFYVVHRPGAPYPVAIQPRGDELPNFLKKSYYRPGLSGFGAAMTITTGEQVTNEWVCDTPSEFRSKLRQAFNLGTVRSEIISLVSGGASSSREIDPIDKEESADGGADGTGANPVADTDG